MFDITADPPRTALTDGKLLPSLSGLLSRHPLPEVLASLEGAGGAGRDRTDDLMLAKQPLSQLSYSPVFLGDGRARRSARRAVGSGRCDH